MVVTFWMIVQQVQLATKLVNTCERCIHPWHPNPSQVLPYPPRRVELNLPSSMNHPLLVFCPSIPCLTKKFTRNTNPPKKTRSWAMSHKIEAISFALFSKAVPSAFLCVRKPEFRIHQYAFLPVYACVSIHILKTQMKKCPSTSQSTTNSSFHFISPSCPSLLLFHSQLLQFPFHTLIQSAQNIH